MQLGRPDLQLAPDQVSQRQLVDVPAGGETLLKADIGRHGRSRVSASSLSSTSGPTALTSSRV